MKKNLFFIIIISLLVSQCKKDDNTDTFVLRDYSEQSLIDHDLLESYLQTHTYNYEDFSNDNNIDIKIDTITSYNANRQSLLDLSKKVTIDVIDANGNLVPHNLYYIIAREG